MGLTKAQLEALNISSFPDNTSELITPEILRTYNSASIANTVNQDTYTTDSASFDSRIDSIVTGTGFVTTSSFNAYTSSNDSKVNSLINATASYANSASVAVVNNAQQAQINSLIAATGSYSTSSVSLTSLNAFTASQNTINSGYNSFTSSQLTKDQTLATYTGSNDTKWATLGSQSGSWITESETGSFATSAITASSLITASIAGQTLTFTKGNGSTFGITIPTGSGGGTADLTSLNAFTSSQLVINTGYNTATASLNSSVTQLNANTSSQQSQINSLIAATGSYLTASVPLTSLNAFTASQLDINSGYNTFTQSANTQLSNLASSQSIDNAKWNTLGGQSGSWITESETGSFARYDVSNPWSANQTFTNISAVSASFQYVQTIFETASVIYSSGSNQFGDAANDTQTLYGNVLIIGSGSINSNRILTTADTGSFTFNTGSFATTGSNVFIGNQTISGSLFQSGSLIQNGLSEISGTINITGSTTIKGTTRFENSSTTITGSLLITGSTIQIGNNLLVGTSTLSGSVFVSGNIEVTNGANLITHNVKAAGSNGLDLLANNGTTIATMGAGGSNQASFTGNLTANVMSASSFTGLGNLTTYSQSVDNRLDSLEALTSSIVPLTSLNAFTASQLTINTGYNTYTSSTNSRLTNIEATTASINSSITQLNASSASQQISINNLNTTTASINSSITQLNASSASQQVSINNLNTTTASLLIETQNLELFSASALVSINSLNSKTGSFATTGSNSFFGTNSFSGAVSFTGSAPSILSSSFSGSVITNLTDIYTNVPAVQQIVTLTSASYAALLSGSLVNPNTLYIVSGSISGSGGGGGTADLTSLNSFTASQYVSNSFFATTGSNTFTGQQSIENFLYIKENGNPLIYTSFSQDLLTNKLIVNQAGASGIQLNSINVEMGQLTASLQEGYVWIGDSTGRTVTVATSSFGTTINTGSFATTGSNTFTGNQNIGGYVKITGNDGAPFQYALETTDNIRINKTTSTSGLTLSGSNTTEALNSFYQNTLWQHAGNVTFTNQISNVGSGSITISALGGGNVSISGSQTNIAGVDFIPFSSSVDSRIQASATTGSNNFVGNQVLTGSLLISSSAAVDLVVTGAISLTGNVLSSGSNGQVQISNVQLSITSNTQTSSAAFGRNVITQASGSTRIGMSANPEQGSWIPGLAKPSIFVSSGSINVNYAPIQFERGDAYTDGRVTFTRPVVLEQALTASLTEGYVWAGGAGNVTTLVPTSSFGSGGSLPSGLLSSSVTNFTDYSQSVDTRINNIVTGTGFATTGSNTFNGNQIINGTFTQSGSNSINVGPNGTGVGTWIQNRVNISGPSSGETPRLYISGSDGAYMELGRGFMNIDTTKTSLGSNTYLGAGVAYGSNNTVAVYNDDYSTDVELQMFANSSSVGFADWDNGSTFSYVPFMTLAPNTGNNPLPQFKRSIGVTGSVDITGQFTINGVPVSGSGGIINTGSFATTGSNNFNGNQQIKNGALQVASYDENLPQYIAPTVFQGVGTASVAYDQFVNAGNYDALHIQSNLNAGTDFQDLNSSNFQLTTWLNIPTNTGDSPAPRFTRGVNVTGNVQITGSTTFSGSITMRDRSGNEGNVYLGLNALGMGSAGSQPLAFGNTIGVAIGNGAMRYASGSSQNVAIGNNTLNKTTGSNNVAIGSESMPNNLTGQDNVAIGINSLNKNTAGSSNFALGGNAMYENTAGSQNVAIGVGALYNNTTGQRNVAIGTDAALQSSGSNNTFVGTSAGQYITGSNNTIIGQYTGTAGQSVSDTIVLAAGSSVKAQYTGSAWSFEGEIKLNVGSNKPADVVSVASGGTTVNNSLVNGSSIILLTTQNSTTSPVYPAVVTSKTTGQFTIRHGSGDSLNVAYLIINPTA
jgi:hypothetical protein